MIWFQCPRWLSTAIYIAMGWMIVFVAAPLLRFNKRNGLYLLALGGIFYTIGGVIYGLKPKFLEFKHIGYHEIFHIFILFGSLAHFLSIFLYVI